PFDGNRVRGAQLLREITHPQLLQHPRHLGECTRFGPADRGRVFLPQPRDFPQQLDVTVRRSRQLLHTPLDATQIAGDVGQSRRPRRRDETRVHPAVQLPFDIGNGLRGPDQLVRGEPAPDLVGRAQYRFDILDHTERSGIQFGTQRFDELAETLRVPHGATVLRQQRVDRTVHTVIHQLDEPAVWILVQHQFRRLAQPTVDELRRRRQVQPEQPPGATPHGFPLLPRRVHCPNRNAVALVHESRISPHLVTTTLGGEDCRYLTEVRFTHTRALDVTGC